MRKIRTEGNLAGGEVDDLTDWPGSKKSGVVTFTVARNSAHTQAKLF
jgi:hypothetical protein